MRKPWVWTGRIKTVVPGLACHACGKPVGQTIGDEVVADFYAAAKASPRECNLYHPSCYDTK